MKKMKWILGLLLIVALVIMAATAMADLPEGATAPQPITEAPTYTGQPIGLITAGVVEEGTDCKFQYRINEEEDWADAVPTETNANQTAVTVYWQAINEEGSVLDSGEIEGTVIQPATLTLEWSGCTDLTYDGQEHVPSAELSGAFDEITVSVSTNAPNKKDAGNDFTATADLKAADGVLDNYTQPTNLQQSYSIAKKELTVTWSTDELTYNGTAQAHTPSVSGAVTGETITISVADDQKKKDAGTGYTATATLSYTEPAKKDNYILAEGSSLTDTFSIGKADLTLTWGTTTEFTYTGEEQKPTAELTGQQNGEDITVVVTGETAANDDAKAKAAIYYGSGVSSGNYTEPTTTSLEQSFKIKKAKLTAQVAWEASFSTETYDGFPHSAGVTLDGAVHNEVPVAVAKLDEYTEVTNAGEYPVLAELTTADVNKNYEIESRTPEKLTIKKAPLTLTWGTETEFTYNGTKQAPTAELTGIIGSESVGVSIEGETNANDSALATATITGESSVLANYEMPSNLTQSFKINKAELTATVAWADGFSGTYDGSEHGATVTLTGAVSGETPEATATLDGQQTVVNAKEEGYVVATALTTDDVNKNYVISASSPETLIISPATISPSWATYTNSWVYTGSEIEPEVKMTDSHGNVMTEGSDKDFTVSYTDNVIVASEPKITVIGTRNYDGQFELPFTITPKPISDKSITIDPIADEVYTTKAIEPEPVVTDTDERKAAKLVKGEDYTVTYANNVKVSDTTELGAAQITITGKGNYTGTNGTTFIITRKPVKAITTTVNGPTEDTKRLGGPDSSRYHTITIDAEANEKMTVKITQDGAAVTVLKDFTAGDITIEKDAINGAALDGSGDVTYTVYAEYDDKDNLTTDEKSSRDSKPAPGVEDKFNYDTVAKAITVHPLYNRAAKGVGVTLPEGYRLVKFTSSGAGTDFVATNAASLAAGDHVIPFDVGENPKLNSTAKGGTFTGLYEDYVGNPGKVDKQDILKAKGTIEIISVEPPINDSGRIGNTPNLIFTVKMGADGGYSELANGGVFGTRTLSQGEQQITVAASSLVADGTNTPSLSFDDLEGSATFRSFIFDPVCDEPVLTFEPYAGCYYLMGLAEPYSQIVIEVNGEKVTGSADAFGVFALKMPLTEEGDIISIRVTDLAGNVTTTSYRVGPEIEDATMTAFMAGRVYTNAHGMRGGKPDWTMILTASVDDLKAGNVNVPIIAGNMVSIGTMSVKMDDSNNLSYSYTLDDGVQVLNEKFIANTRLEKDAFIAGLGIEVSPNGTLISDIQKGKVYLSCKMNVKVPAEMLKATFQTEKIKDSDLKKRYRDIQNGKLN